MSPALPDGSSVNIRQIGPADRDALVAMYDGVSDESRYSRFLNAHPELRSAELTYLTEVDHHDHEALVAFVADGGPMVGVVRYVRTEDDEAEPAMLITDDWQGRGLVTLMLELLVARAWEAGIRHFRAPVRPTNLASLRALDALGESVHHAVGTEVEVEVALRPPLTEGALVRRAQPGAHGFAREGGSRAPITAATVIGDLIPRRLPSDGQRTNTIVVGASAGAVGEAVVDAAAELAQTLGARLVLVRAWRSRPEADVESELELLARRARARGAVVETSVRRTTPAAAIVDACVEEGAAMVVLGPSRRRRKAAPGGLVGAVADLVVRQAPCNVLLLNPAADLD